MPRLELGQPQQVQELGRRGVQAGEERAPQLTLFANSERRARWRVESWVQRSYLLEGRQRGLGKGLTTRDNMSGKEGHGGHRDGFIPLDEIIFTLSLVFSETTTVPDRR